MRKSLSDYRRQCERKGKCNWPFYEKTGIVCTRCKPTSRKLFSYEETRPRDGDFNCPDAAVSHSVEMLGMNLSCMKFRTNIREDCHFMILITDFYVKEECPFFPFFG